MTDVVRNWTTGELAILDEARAKLERKATVSAAVGLAGLLATIVSFLLLPAGGVLFFGAVVAGPLLALDAKRKQQRLNELRPGTGLCQAVLGVATSADPPHTNNRTAVVVLGSLIALLFGFVILALMFG